MDKIIKTIRYEDQRYPTCGDYWFDPTSKATQFRVNAMGNEDFEFLVSIHEQIEEHLTRRKGIREEDIKAFDEMWEKELANGLHDENEEPGHDPRSPYREDHVFAECIERLLAARMGVDWDAYDKAVMASCDKPHPADPPTCS